MSELLVFNQLYSCPEITKAQSTDDQSSNENKNQKVYKTNLCKYKTQMCKNYSQMGFCPYRAKCQFAHGLNQLSHGAAVMGTKKAYRTKKCKSFWEEGICRYGFRCQFLHYQPNLQKQKEYLDFMSKMITPEYNSELRLKVKQTRSKLTNLLYMNKQNKNDEQEEEEQKLIKMCC